MSDDIKNKQEDAQKQPSQNEQIQDEQKQDFWSDRQYKDMVFYLLIALFILELIIGGIAFFYGIINAEVDPNGGPPRFQFPWLAYGLAAVLAPTIILLILQLSGFDVFRQNQRKFINVEAWEEELPPRFRKTYLIIKNAPTVVLLVSILLLGTALVYVDGAIGAIFQLGKSMEAYLPWIIGALVAIFCIIYMGRVWLAYRTRRLEEEYAFRREIFEQTGQIIVDRGSIQLPPQEHSIAIEATPIQALPSNDTQKDTEIIIEVSEDSTDESKK